MQNAAQIINDPIESYTPTDEQIDKYFESGGKEGILEPPANDQKEAIAEIKPEEKAEVQVKVEPERKETPIKPEHERNAIAAMIEERERRRELQREVEELKSHKNKMEERFQAFLQAAKTPQQPIPSYDEDPLGALRHETEHLKQNVNRFNQIEQQRAQENEMHRRRQEFVEKYRGDAVTFSKENTDFIQAYNHLRGEKFNEYKLAGYSDGQANQLLIEDEMAIANKAYQDGVNPAERVYALAKLRGYKKVEAEVPEQKAEEQKPNNLKEAEKKFEAIEKGIRESKSLNGSSGGRPEKGFSLETLAEMDDDEFSNITPAQWRKLVESGN